MNANLSGKPANGNDDTNKNDVPAEDAARPAAEEPTTSDTTSEMTEAAATPEETPAPETVSEAPVADVVDTAAAASAPTTEGLGAMNVDLRTELTTFGFAEAEIDVLSADGVQTGADLGLYKTAEALQAAAGCAKSIPAKKAFLKYGTPAAAPADPLAVPAAGAVDPSVELPEGKTPGTSDVTGFAGQLGVDPTAMLMFMGMSGGNMGADFDLSGMIPIRTVVDGYSPKLRNMFLMVMGQIESRLGVPIVVIDSNGGVNRELTTVYIESLEEGFEPAENNIYFGDDGQPREVIRVGVDAQSIFDADPLEPTKALPKNNIGVGRVRWVDVSLEVRQVCYQVCYFAVTRTNEIDPKSDGHQAWLRDHIKPGVNRLVFHGQAPLAIGAYNDAARTGSLPTLRVMLTRGPRKKEIMPRRRRRPAGIGELMPPEADES